METDKNIFTIGQKRDLKVLIEDFLEKDRNIILIMYEKDENRISGIFKELFQILSKNTIDINNLIVSDLTEDELKKAALMWHQELKPLWDKLKKVLFEYKVLPDRKWRVETGIEMFFPIAVKRKPVLLNVTFDAGRVSIFRGNLSAVDAFIDIIKDAPLELFEKCVYCKHTIIITRKGKRYCSGCAAKAKQQEMWKNNPELCREREKLRYREKRRRE